MHPNADVTADRVRRLAAAGPEADTPDARDLEKGEDLPAGGDLPESLRRIGWLGLTHRTQDPRRIGEAAPADAVAAARRIADRDRVTGAVVLATCDRLEVYLATRTAADVQAGLDAAREAVDGLGDAERATGLDAVVHLGRVACGLESSVLGEDEVLGQVRRAFEAAEEAGLARGVLRRVADAAVAAGRRSRAETAIDEGAAGYGTATCEAVAAAVGEPERLVLLGAGEVARSVARAATHRFGARIDVVNRSPARSLASDDGRYWPLERLVAAVDGADAVVSATASPDPVVTRPVAAGAATDAVFVDLARPRDVAEAVAEDHEVVPLERVQARVAATVERRRRAVPAVEERLAERVRRLVACERERRAEATLRALHREAKAIEAAELERARNRLAAGDADPEAVLEDFASALTGTLLADPTDALRRAARDGDEETVATARRLFDLGEPDPD